MPKAKPKTHTLRRVKTDEVSLVDRGAVQRTFCLRKRSDAMDEILKACLEAPLDDEAAIDARLTKAGVSEKGAVAIKGALSVLTAFRDELRDTDLTLLTELAGGAPPADAEVEAGADKETDAEDAEKASGDVNKAQEAAVAIPPEVQAQVEAVQKANREQQEQIAKLQKALAEQQDAAALRANIEKAAQEYPDLAPPAVLGPILKRLSEAGMLADVEPILRGANERGKADALLKEYGSAKSWGRTDGDDVQAKLNRATQEIAAKENVPLSKAMALAVERNPEMYLQYDTNRKVVAHG